MYDIHLFFFLFFIVFLVFPIKPGSSKIAIIINDCPNSFGMRINSISA